MVFWGFFVRRVFFLFSKESLSLFPSLCCLSNSSNTALYSKIARILKGDCSPPPSIRYVFGYPFFAWEHVTLPVPHFFGLFCTDFSLLLQTRPFFERAASCNGLLGSHLFGYAKLNWSHVIGVLLAYCGCPTNSGSRPPVPLEQDTSAPLSFHPTPCSPKDIHLSFRASRLPF